MKYRTWRYFCRFMTCFELGRTLEKNSVRTKTHESYCGRLPAFLSLSICSVECGTQCDRDKQNNSVGHCCFVRSFRRRTVHVALRNDVASCRQTIVLRATLATRIRLRSNRRFLPPPRPPRFRSPKYRRVVDLGAEDLWHIGNTRRGGPNLLRITFPVRHLVSHFPPPWPALSVVCFLRLAPLFLACPPLHTAPARISTIARFSLALLFYFFPLLASSNFNFIQSFPLHFYFAFFLTSSASVFLWYITIYFSARSLFLSLRLS